MRILICGGRDFTNRQQLVSLLDSFFLIHNRGAENALTIIHGAARGADTLADEYAKVAGLNVEAYPAEWDKYGRSAGPVRNAQMLREGRPDLVIAFPGGAGTRNMIEQARRANVPVLEVVP